MPNGINLGLTAGGYFTATRYRPKTHIFGDFTKCCVLAKNWWTLLRQLSAPSRWCHPELRAFRISEIWGNATLQTTPRLWLTLNSNGTEAALKTVYWHLIVPDQKTFRAKRHQPMQTQWSSRSGVPNRLFRRICPSVNLFSSVSPCLSECLASCYQLDLWCKNRMRAHLSCLKLCIYI